MCPPLRLAGAALVALALGACGSDPVTDEPGLVGVSTVRGVEELPEADIATPEVAGRREVRFRYTVASCGGPEGSVLPEAVEASYTVDSVALVVTPAPLDCGEAEDPAEVVRALEVFLDEPVDGRAVSGRLAAR